MSLAIRRMFACLLLVLLPFQAFAASNAAAEAPLVACPMAMMADMGCCDDDGGCASMDCVAVSPAALPASVAPCIDPGESAEATHIVPLLHESHFPDGLQRPPQAPV
jgi:hypothetical protein